MGRWYLVRHGRTGFNRDNRIQGQSQMSLDEEGLAQARKLRNRLAGETFVAAYSSDLLRAQQTAQVILGDNSDIRLLPSADLRELDYGQWEGLTLEEVRARDGDQFSRMMTGDRDFAPPGGESVNQLLERVGRFVERVKTQVKEGNILVICHGGSLRGLVVQLLALPASAFWSLQVDLASLSLVDVYPNRAVLVLFNDASHLGCAP